MKRFGIFLKSLILAVVVLATVLALMAAVMSYRGRQNLARVKNELTARGEKLTWTELAPSPYPAILNICEDPIWRPPDLDAGGSPDQAERSPIAAANSPLTESEQRRCLELFDLPTSETRLDAAWKGFHQLAGTALSPAQAHWILETLHMYDPILTHVNGLMDRPFAKISGQ